VTYFLTNAFGQVESLVVIDATRRSLLEQEIARSQEVSFAENARLVARTVGAGLSMTGRSGTRIGAKDQVTIQYDLDDLLLQPGNEAYRGTRQVVEFSSPKRAMLQDLGRHVVELVVENLRIPIDTDLRRRLARPPTRSLEAFLACAEGLLWEEGGEYAKAYESYQTAAQLDPGFGWAGDGIDRLSGAGAHGEPIAPDAAPAGGSYSEQQHIAEATEVARQSVDDLPASDVEEPPQTPALEPPGRVTIIIKPR
jgi:hypothetical protein